VEREGVARGDRARAVADLVLVVMDASEGLTDDDMRLLERTADRRRVLVLNKTDIAIDQHTASASAADARVGVGHQCGRRG
jgi:tRNA modification GTPase